MHYPTPATGRIQTKPQHDGTTVVTITAPDHNEFSGEDVCQIVQTIRPHKLGAISTRPDRITCVLPTPIVTGQISPEVLQGINAVLRSAQCDPIVLDVREPEFADGGPTVQRLAYQGTVHPRGFSADLPFGPIAS
jgi:hypothetical protein